MLCMESIMLNFFTAESACLVCRPWRMKNRAVSGVRSMATTNEVARAIETAMGSARMNSPVEPLMSSRGAKEEMMVMVAVKTGTAISEAQRPAASSRGTL